MAADISNGQQWAWPRDLDVEHNVQNHTEQQPTPTPTSQPSGPHLQPTPGPSEAAGSPPPRPQRHYKPRTCRICLEVVQPTTEIDDTLAGRVFQNRARVRYVSEDPELGRLFSPCKCKGSQKYVHEGCLQAWRNSRPQADRNFWRCPTCLFEYRLERLRWGRWLSSTLLRSVLTVLIMLVTVFILGFIADPIIDFWIDPLGSVTSPLLDFYDDEDIHPLDQLVGEPDGWAYHFLKGFMSLGLLGFLKAFYVASPFRWFNVRVGGGRRGRGGTGRDRVESINWAVVIIGVITFLGATWKFVSHVTARVLEKASNRVTDVQDDSPGDDDEEEDEPDAQAPETAGQEEPKKDR